QELKRAFDHIGLTESLSRVSKVFVKPNFTFPRYTPGVTTSPQFLKDLLGTIAEHTAEVFVGESNGGYGSFLASEAFAGHGLHEICRETKTTAVNLSDMESKIYSRKIAGKTTTVRLPRFLS